MQTLPEERPPYVDFVVKAVEDRNATVAAGRYIAKDVDYAVITPFGGKDRVERPVAEWFPQMEEAVRGERFRRDWLEAYKGAYRQWKAGEEIPLDGTPIKSWSLISPAQQRNLIELNIRTVEDLAQATEEALQHLGMGAVELKARAANWLVAQKNDQPGKLAMEISSLAAKVQELSASLEAKDRTIAALQAAKDKAAK